MQKLKQLKTKACYNSLYCHQVRTQNRSIL